VVAVWALCVMLVSIAREVTGLRESNEGMDGSLIRQGCEGSQLVGVRSLWVGDASGRSWSGGAVEVGSL